MNKQQAMTGISDTRKVPSPAWEASTCLRVNRTRRRALPPCRLSVTSSRRVRLTQETGEYAREKPSRRQNIISQAWASGPDRVTGPRSASAVNVRDVDGAEETGSEAGKWSLGRGTPGAAGNTQLSESSTSSGGRKSEGSSVSRKGPRPSPEAQGHT